MNELTLQDLLVVYAEYVQIDAVPLQQKYTDTITQVEAHLLIGLLPQKLQQPLLLWAQGYTMNEIGCICKISTTSVWRYIHKALRILIEQVNT